jgi:hypothetical protein
MPIPFARHCWIGRHFGNYTVWVDEVDESRHFR